MLDTLKIVAIGNSLGVILPKEILAKLRVDKGDELHVHETSDGVELSPFDPDFEADMQVGKDVARRYRNTLHNLAK